MNTRRNGEQNSQKLEKQPTVFPAVLDVADRGPDGRRDHDHVDADGDPLGVADEEHAEEVEEDGVAATGRLGVGQFLQFFNW